MRYFVLDQVVGSEAETDFEPVGEVTRGEAPRCPACGRFVGMLPWLPPYRVKLRTYGSRLGDVAFDVGNNLVLSESFVTAWRSEGLKGLDHLDPVDVVSIRPKSRARKSERYFHFAVPRTNTTVDWSKSVFLGKAPTCECCGGGREIEAILSLRLDDTSWTGEDIFIPRGTSRTIVTERVVDLAKNHDLANVTTIPLEEFRWDPLWKLRGMDPS